MSITAIKDRDLFNSKYVYSSSTQIIKQYLDIKYEHQEHLLIFRIGDFYEFFFEDAGFASKILEINLTKKSGKIDMCGFPISSLNENIKRLLKAGKSIALCEQVENVDIGSENLENKEKIIKREVVNIITQGLITIDDVLDVSLPNYLLSLFVKDKFASIAIFDALTLEFLVYDINLKNAKEEVESVNAREILTNTKKIKEELNSFIGKINAKKIIFSEDIYNESQKSLVSISNYYKTQEQKELSTTLSATQIGAIELILNYTSKFKLNLKLPFPRMVEKNLFMNLDSSTLRNLEIIKPLNENGMSLLKVINKTLTKQGSRLLYKYLMFPLKDSQEINKRLDIVDFFLNSNNSNKIFHFLDSIGDLDRISAKILSKKCMPKDLVLLKKSLISYNKLQEIIIKELNYQNDNIYKNIINIFHEHQEIIEIIEDTIIEDSYESENFIKDSYHSKLLELTELIENSEFCIKKLEEKYIKTTSIENLKILKNNLLGLHIEIPMKKSDKIDTDFFLHKQSTLSVNRFITHELKDLESKIINAKFLKTNLQNEILNNIYDQISQNINSLVVASEVIAKIDVFFSFSSLAKENNYVRPIVDDKNETKIELGRHAIIEKKLQNKFVPNDLNMNEKEKILIITGSNMGGKSTYLRQSAIIQLMSQIGCFVPAKYAHIGVVDRIFTRIGSGDDLYNGRSTFMVEMLEVANIIEASSDKSLLIMDEVGRGTSNVDGICLSHAILEYIHNKIDARCLFATHYSELTELEKHLPKISNYFAESVLDKDGIVFTHKILKGKSNDSYGIEVAKISGINNAIIARAREIKNQILV